MSATDLLTRAQSALIEMRVVLTKEREAVLAFNAQMIAECAERKTRGMQELWLISAQLRKEMMKDENAGNEALSFEMRAYRDAMLEVRAHFARNERLLHFARELSNTVLAAQRPDPVRYDNSGQTRPSDPALLNRRV